MKLFKPVFLLMAMALSMVSMTAYAEDLDDVTVQVLNADDNSVADAENSIDMPDADSQEVENEHQGQGNDHEDASNDDSSQEGMDDSHEDEHDEMEGEHEDEHEDDDNSTPAT